MVGKYSGKYNKDGRMEFFVHCEVCDQEVVLKDYSLIQDFRVCDNCAKLLPSINTPQVNYGATE